MPPKDAAEPHDRGLADAVDELAAPPDATLQVATQGQLTIAADGLASQGSFAVTTSNNRIPAVYGDGTIVLSLDLGNDGTIDRTWTLTRPAFVASAG